MKHLRDQIDALDSELLKLLAKRQAVILQVADFKKAHALALQDKDREAAMIETLKKEAEDLGLSSDFVESIFVTILKESLRLQESR